MGYPVLEFDYSKPVKRPKPQEYDTRQLKKMLDIARACGGKYCFAGDAGGPGLTFDELKAELDTREHIPNKQEARLVRQQKARAKRNR